jgi:hypothetical protein
VLPGARAAGARRGGHLLLLLLLLFFFLRWWSSLDAVERATLLMSRAVEPQPSWFRGCSRVPEGRGRHQGRAVSPRSYLFSTRACVEYTSHSLNYVASESAANQEVRGLGRSDRGANSFTLTHVHLFHVRNDRGGPKSRVTLGASREMAKPPRLRRLWRNPSCLDQWWSETALF